MSTITITVTDIDLDTGEYQVDFKAEGFHINEGIATAAYVTGHYLYKQVNTPEFLNGVSEFSQRLVINLDDKAGKPLPSATEKSTTILILDDIDPNTGEYRPLIKFLGGHPEGDHLPSSAVVVGVYMRWLLHDMAFQSKVWEYAEQLAAKSDGGYIMNADYAPNNDVDDAASAA